MTLVVIEAMKMENLIKAPAAGRIREVFVEAGQAVDKNDKLIEMEAE
jgi:biotin carboxyl carrier protein